MADEGIGSGILLSMGATEAAMLPTQKLRARLVPRRLTSILVQVIIVWMFNRAPQQNAYTSINVRCNDSVASIIY